MPNPAAKMAALPKECGRYNVSNCKLSSRPFVNSGSETAMGDGDEDKSSTGYHGGHLTPGIRSPQP